MKTKLTLIAGASALAMTMGFSPAAHAASCPTVNDPMGVDTAFPQQLDLTDYKALEIKGNPLFDGENLPAAADRIPAEALVVLPYDDCGQYGGTLRGLSNATEAGTSDLLSVRHVNLVRYSDDLQTIVPNIAKSWEYNDDFTKLTFKLREGHKWSDGEPFTSADVAFWYNDLILNKNIFPETPSAWLFDGKPMKVETPDATTVVFNFPVPAPSLTVKLASTFAQPFQPKHFFEKMHATYNPDADKLATEKGFENWAAMVNNYYGASDWKDVPSPLLKGTDTVVVPTLESHILIEETSEGRKLKANPYFFQVDTAGNQLPYIDFIDERYVPDKEVRNLKIANGEVDYKAQALFLEDFSYYKENEGNGNYTVELSPGLGTGSYYSFNTTIEDENKREFFANPKFSEAMSIALNREEINELVYLAQGEPMMSSLFEPLTADFIDEDLSRFAIDYDPEKAKAILDELDLVDRNGDGLRDLKNGDTLIVRVIYSNQGAPVRMHELAAGYWGDIGVRVDLKEVTSDEYRELGNNNALDIATWNGASKSYTAVFQSSENIVPPFGDYFEPVTGVGWAQWKQSGGTEGVEPPADIKKLWDLTDQFLQKAPGTAENEELGQELAAIHNRNFIRMGVIGNVSAPVIKHNRVKNIPLFSAATYDYYRTYPFRPSQWYIEN
ncbi:ABC transporter substrate-binding protein [Kiloniella sp. b19]|uniref:ABC transporter substrate-binding protein n=1 Tax=Kiloniella sp. GXU_MW_B19 TaxID=3141326 RepID=UPI0031D127B5